MSVDTGKELFRIGFLTAIEIPDRGYVGGLLVTNHFGRPLEFQCTAPLKPNRAQEILYGPTLVPYVLGDLIGRTLIEKVGVKPHLVLTERMELLDLRELVAIPVACVDDVPADLLTSRAAGIKIELRRIGPEGRKKWGRRSQPVTADEPAPVLEPPNDEPASNGSTDVGPSSAGNIESVNRPSIRLRLNADSTRSAEMSIGHRDSAQGGVCHQPGQSNRQTGVAGGEAPRSLPNFQLTRR